MTDLSQYPHAIEELLRQMPLAPLGPGQPVRAVKPSLDALTNASFGTVTYPDMAAACRAGLWLAFNFHDESHAISQELHTAEGSYWHAILHRREPDASNASYWFRRVGEHPIFKGLVVESQELGFPLSSARWDPFRFVDLCEQERGTGSQQEMLLRRVQQREWELLFDWCFRTATGKG